MSKVQWLGQVRPPQPEPVHPIIANAEKMIALAGGPRVEHLGEPADDGSTWAVTWTFLSMAGAALAAYHGYKRNHESTGAAVGWGVLGGLFPIITVPVALAQGYGKPKGASDNPRPGAIEGEELYVHRDWTTSGNGRWRLVWSVPGSTSFIGDESTVTGKPYFKTMREAVQHGEHKYGVKARKADW